MPNKLPSVPLTSPAGVVFAHACGVCLRVGMLMYSLGQMDAEEVASAAEHSREDADRCCVCRSCKVVGKGIGHECPACQAKREAEWKAGDPERIAKQAAEDADVEATFAKSSDPAAARELMRRMSDLSEECYCAGWLIGCEFTLWHFLGVGPGEWGQGVVSQADLFGLRALSEKCGGWIAWRDDIGNVFVPLAEWLPMYKAEQERSKAWLVEYEASQARRAAEEARATTEDDDAG